MTGLFGDVMELTNKVRQQFDVSGAVVEGAQIAKLPCAVPGNFADRVHGIPRTIPGPAFF